MKAFMIATIAFITVSFGTFSQVDGDTTAASSDWIIPSSINAPLEMLTPPPTFEPSTAFNGYISLKTSSAIVMILINDANYLSIVEGITDEYLAKNQLELVSREDFKTPYGVSGINFKLKFTLEGTEFVRYMTFIGDLETTLWLNTTYPKMLEDLVEPEILTAIHTVNLYPKGNE
jgi:hypothetical protein